MSHSLRSLRRALAIGATALGVLVLAPQVASATVTCVANDQEQMIIHMYSAGDSAVIAANADGTITMNVPCTGPKPPTVHSVDRISVLDFSQGSTEVVLDLTQGSLAPGSDELEAAPGAEIDTELHLGAGTDTLRVAAHHAGDSIVAGELGVNLNPDVEGFAQDADVSMDGVDRITVEGSEFVDWMNGKGGWGTGGPSALGLILQGMGGNDQLEGGAPAGLPSGMFGDEGDDTLVAGTGAGYMEGGPGDDKLKGGPARDEVTYAHAAAGVTVDLALAGPQDTAGAGVDTITGVENVSGSDHRDVLSGDDGFNIIDGGHGDDVLDGRAGDDGLYGSLGADLLRSGPGAAHLDGGDGEDAVAYEDAAGPIRLDLGISAYQDVGGAGLQELVSVEGVIGSPFGDRLIGSAGADTMEGGAGADTIDGGEGSDRLGGGAGIDIMDSRDSSPDSVSCGEGPDSLAVDALDTLAADCVPEAPGGGEVPGGGVPVGASAPVLGVGIPRQSLRRVLARGLRVELTCTTACTAGGRLVVTRAVARRLGLGRRVGRLGPVDLAAGTPRKVRVGLSRRARAALRRTRAVRLVLRAQAADAAGQAAAPVRRPVRLR